MLKRLTYLVTGGIFFLLAAVMFWYASRLNTLTLAQQQTQRQMTQWRDQSAQNSDYRELQATVKNTATRTEALARQLTDVSATQTQQLQPLTDQIKTLENRLQTLTTRYQHLQQQSDTRSRVTAKPPVPSPHRAATAHFSLIGTEFRAGRQFAVIAPSGYRALSQLQLVAPGDNVQGWQLQQLDSRHATFRKRGQRLTLNAGG